MTKQPVAMQKSAVHAPPHSGFRKPPRDDSAAQSPNAEYDRAYGDTGSPSSQSQTRKSQLGASYSACSHYSLLNSNCRSSNCNSQQRCMPPRVSSAPGATETGIVSTSPNGSSRSGTSPWTQSSAAPRERQGA